MRDLTQEFQKKAKRIAGEKGIVLRGHVEVEPSQFQRESEVIWRALDMIDKKVAKLTALAKKDGIFDDATMEISELTNFLKTDRDRIEAMLEVLQQKAAVYGNSEHATRHAESILKTLQMRLGESTQNFTKALELRARTMQLQQKKRLAFTGPQMTMDNPASSGGDVSLNMGNGTAGDAEGGQYMQQELLDLDPQAQQVRAIEDIQKTLVQLGQMFSQFSVLVQRQGEQIERIDDQVEQTQSNIEKAQEQLLEYYRSISGNRSLIMKLFGVTAGFLVVFVMFFV